MAQKLMNFKYFSRENMSLDVVAPWGVFLLILLAFQIHWLSRRKSTALRGPPRQSFIFGAMKLLLDSDDPAVILEKWAEKYGSVFRLPVFMGSSQIALCDPKAASYFYSREIIGFQNPKQLRILIERLVGRGILWAEGDGHKRQRKTLSPAFSIQAIRSLSTIFFDSAYKVIMAWDAALDASTKGETLIDVQAWMNKVSLDSIGIAGFAHDFETLTGRPTAVAEAFESFADDQSKQLTFTNIIIFLILPMLPSFVKIPTNRAQTVVKLNKVMEKIADNLLARTRHEKDVDHTGTGKSPKSIIETLVLAEDAQSERTLTRSEVLAQVKTLIVAGYETTSISLTWALINLSLQPNIQQALRTELSQLNTDPTFDQLTKSLPFLDAVTRETLRLQPPIRETTRIATTDHIIPLHTPLKTLDGKTVDSVFIASGTTVTVPIRLMNRSKAIWGKNAADFDPKRWLASDAEIPERAQEIHGYSHLLTFIDGPRSCLGRHFAVTEFKAVLATLIRHYEFRLPGGADTKLEQVIGVLPRPKVVGEEGTRVPMLVKRVS